MPEGTLCNRVPVNTKEQLMALLDDKGGRKYYDEMKRLDIDREKLNKMTANLCRSRIRTWLDICARCGLCADACFIYTARGKDPKLSPAYKIQSTLGEIIRRKGDVDNAFMHYVMETSWANCTCCSRCAMYCPHGIDTGQMFGVMRALMFGQGFIPWELKIGSGMHRIYRAQMDVTTEDWVETCSWMCEENEDEWPGLEIPVDKEGADFMYTLNAREVKHYPEDIAEAAILFHIAGENWTVPSEGWEETSLAMFAGDGEACKLQVETVYAAMDRLKPKRMVVTECGHAYRATVIEGPYWAGRKNGQTPIPSIHYVEWVAEALKTGKLKIDPAKKIKEPVTYQDSCNYIRNAGLKEAARTIMSYIAEDFREMDPCMEHNHCCGGGGGLNGIGIYRPQRNIGLKVKRDQIVATGAKLVVAPCHNCWDAIRDLEEVYEIGIRWSFLKPLLINMIEVPEGMRSEE
jgi:Fe-S oxidoreductase